MHGASLCPAMLTALPILISRCRLATMSITKPGKNAGIISCATDFAQIVWDTPAALPGYDFLEGDVEFVQRLATEQERQQSH